MDVRHDFPVYGNGREKAMRMLLVKEKNTWKRLIHRMDAAAHFIRALRGFEKIV